MVLTNANKTLMYFDLLFRTQIGKLDEAQLPTLVMLANICPRGSLRAGFKENTATSGGIKAGAVNLNKRDNGQRMNLCLFESVDIKSQH